MRRRNCGIRYAVSPDTVVNEIAEISLCAKAEKDLSKLRNAEAVLKIENVLERLKDLGWQEAIDGELILKFSAKGFRGDVYYVKIRGLAEVRIFFFCRFEERGRVLQVVRVAKKSRLKGNTAYRDEAEETARAAEVFSRTGEC